MVQSKTPRPCPDTTRRKSDDASNPTSVSPPTAASVDFRHGAGGAARGKLHKKSNRDLRWDGIIATFPWLLDAILIDDGGWLIQWRETHFVARGSTSYHLAMQLGASRPMKMGTIASPLHYDGAMGYALQSANLSRWAPTHHQRRSRSQGPPLRIT